MTLSELADWVDGVPGSLPEEMRPMAESICESFQTAARRLMELGLGYLTLDRAASTLSTGERQRMQLARAVRNRTTGVLYVLDEPSIGLHPSNIDGPAPRSCDDLVADGNSVLLVDHDTQILSASGLDRRDGPGGRCRRRTGHRPGHGGQISDAQPDSQIGPFLSGKAGPMVRRQQPRQDSCLTRGASTSPPGRSTRSSRWRRTSPRAGSPSSPVYPARARPPWCWKA